MRKAISEVNMNLVTGKAHTIWMDLSDKLTQELKRMESAPGIEQQRKAFVVFNNNFYKTIKTFGLQQRKVYYQFCPMANNDKGAYWLSKTEPIENPYYGDEMLTCGENKETLEY
ncbi:MAG: DUF3347 domain-containing protein [Bacteroidales bacterium]|nr:DUF3347 domain-containing protein [Bacteroidales bacterium]